MAMMIGCWVLYARQCAVCGSVVVYGVGCAGWDHHANGGDGEGYCIGLGIVNFRLIWNWFNVLQEITSPSEEI